MNTLGTKVIRECAGLSAGALVYFSYTFVDNGLVSLLHLYAPSWSPWWVTLFILCPFSAAVGSAWSRSRAQSSEDHMSLVTYSMASLFATVVMISFLIGMWHPSFQPDKSLWSDQDWKFFGNLSLFSGTFLLVLGARVAKIFVAPKGNTVTL